MTINLIKKAYIKAQIKFHIKILLFKEIFIIILLKYFNYSNIFLTKNIIKFLKYIKINNLAIKLEKNKQPLFKFIYS